MSVIHYLMKYLLSAFLVLLPIYAQAEKITVKDIAGRTVVINAPVERAMLADSRVLIALNILHPSEPLKSIVAWDNALEKKAPDLATAYEKDFPQLRKIPVFPNPYTSDFSIEKALTYNPDLVIFDIGLKSKLDSSNTVDLLAKSGIPVIFIDFRQHPLSNTVPSMKLLGTVFGQEENANKFIQFYENRLSLIKKRIATLSPQQLPSIFIERHAGMRGAEDCCNTFATNNFGEFVAAAGANNMGSKWFSGMGGKINEEQLLTTNPDYYLMTVANWDTVHENSQSVPLGYTGELATAEKRFQKLLSRPKLNVLKSYREKHVMAVYHQYYDTPFNIIAVEAIAKWLHPDLFQDIDPHADNIYVHKTFTALDGSGVFWLTAK
ncbi:substrate-binding protein [Xenorhabdus mauleonii]|uniref:Substrate-binding protein n=1 Tax=Xenorhabdus mauleonii TaxID=351675 RepID=A0A1I3RQK0_9GAMM|nr:ABC transporter substrate-binding protein [Xenorhabdus mauleonii]PHM46472.1 substrate-binding protein [Xenorhabdus mauleonii]SFJ48162.1 iron complex transport system substrate-binding protein [Xenorhabdus mauleonii]